MGNAVEEGPDVDVQHPVVLPTTLTSHRQSVIGTAPGTIATRIVAGPCFRDLPEPYRRGWLDLKGG
jgi:hypothetical protein